MENALKNLRENNFGKMVNRLMVEFAKTVKMITKSKAYEKLACQYNSYRTNRISHM